MRSFIRSHPAATPAPGSSSPFALAALPLLAALLLLVASPATFSQAAAATSSLRLVRVMLSAGGVGYFEYEARVSGDASLELSVPLSQVDDVMKSIVVYDSSGLAGGIRLAGRNPLRQVFEDLPFDAEALDSPVALLNALPGAQIRVSGQRELSGRLLRVVPETTRTEGGATITRHRVSVMSGAGLQTFIFEEADSVRFTHAQLAAQVERALAAVARHRSRDRRTLLVSSSGNGERTVRVGYVVSAPLWKASYRLSLDDAAVATAQQVARLQGWAVLENMSGQDWQQVELTLVSGNPVTFRQALYDAYYADRPEVPVEVLGRVLPMADSGTVAMAPSPSRPEMDAGRKPAAPAPMVAGEALRGAMAPATEAVMAEAPMPAPPPQARLLAAASREAATSVSFRVPRPVSVESGQSLLVPIIDRRVPSRRIALYQPATHARHPLAAVELENDGDSGLPPGVLTLYERTDAGSAFVGDAQLSSLPAGESRLVSYALDQKTVVDVELESDQSVASARMVNGILELTYSQVQRALFRIKAPAGEARSLRIEHPRRPGWNLDEPDGDGITLTEGHYRIAAQVEAGAQAALSVVMSRPSLRKIALLDLRARQFVQYASTQELAPALRAAFKRMASLRQEVDRQQQALQQQEQGRDRIHEEQERIRGNLSRVPRDSDLHRRYLRKLEAQEDRMESLLEKADTAREALRRARAALTDYIGKLDM
jgi:hypothetical protein